MELEATGTVLPELIACPGRAAPCRPGSSTGSCWPRPAGRSTSRPGAWRPWVHPAGGRPHRVADGPGARPTGVPPADRGGGGRDRHRPGRGAGGHRRRGGSGAGWWSRSAAGSSAATRCWPEPFGPGVTYADWTASGRALGFVGAPSAGQVLPWYANTHTESSGTGRHTTRLREQARQVIHQAVGGTDQDVVVFCGSGATAAVAKLVGLLELGALARPAGPRPVVFVGPFEHHSNLLWRESAAEVVAIGEDAAGQVDLGQLEDELRRHADRPLRVGNFSAACSPTSVRHRPHRHPAAPPRRAVGLGLLGRRAVRPHPDGRQPPGRRRPQGRRLLLPHKFVGGPQTPGVLVVRRDLARNPGPDRARGRHRRLRRPGRPTPGRPGGPGGGRHPQGSSSRSGPGWWWPSSRPSGPTSSRRGSSGSFAWRCTAGAATRTWSCSATSRPPAADQCSAFRVRHGWPLPAPRAGGGDAERPVQHPGPWRLLVRRPTAGCSASTPTAPWPW